jgi:hypothetical protein
MNRKGYGFDIEVRNAELLLMELMEAQYSLKSSLAADRTLPELIYTS